MSRATKEDGGLYTCIGVDVTGANASQTINIRIEEGIGCQDNSHMISLTQYVHHFSLRQLSFPVDSMVSDLSLLHSGCGYCSCDHLSCLVLLRNQKVMVDTCC